MAEKSGVTQEQADGEEQGSGGSAQADEVSQGHPGEVLCMQMYILMYVHAALCVLYVYIYTYVYICKVVHIQCIVHVCMYMYMCMQYSPTM